MCKHLLVFLNAQIPLHSLMKLQNNAYQLLVLLVQLHSIFQDKDIVKLIVPLGIIQMSQVYVHLATLCAQNVLARHPTNARLALIK